MPLASRKVYPGLLGQDALWGEALRSYAIYLMPSFSAGLSEFGTTAGNKHQSSQPQLCLRNTGSYQSYFC